MFSNFIYFIIVLLIYTTYQPAEDLDFNTFDTLLSFFLLTAVFGAVTRFQFQRIENKILKESYARLDHHFSRAMTRHSILAIILFALDLYIVHLPEALLTLMPFSDFPTLLALVFILIFTAYLAIVWASAYDAYEKIYASQISRYAYVMSNISFAVPVVIPWFVLSGVSDLINVLPFEPPKRFLDTTVGQVVYFLFFLFIVAVTGPLLIQKSWGCKPLELNYHRYRIEALCARANLSYANILYWPIFEGRMITAGVMGLVSRFRYILVTDALLTLLRPDEIDAVIAHEIGHVKRNHLLFYLFFFGGYMLLSYATFDLIVYLIIYTEPAYRFIIDSGFSQAAVSSALLTASSIMGFLIYFRYIFGYFMRNFERQADCYVYSLFDNARPLITVFEKITLSTGQAADKPNWHHFSISERVGYLLKCEGDRGWITRHDQKVRRSILLFIAGMMIAAAAGYALNFGEAGKKISADFFERIVLREIEKKPNAPELYSLLGDLYYEKNNYLQTLGAYETALALQPENPHVLNNLAWLLATCEEGSIRDPERALDLALKASDISAEPYILDTLAESYYQNGKYREAVSAGEKALEQAGVNRLHYQTQLKKFRQAVFRNELEKQGRDG